MAAVILASLNSARDKGKIASIKSNLKNLGSQAEIYYNDHGTYAGLCTPDNSSIDTSIQPFINELKSIVGTNRVKCFVQPSGGDDPLETRNFAVAVAFNNVHYAVDTTGVVTFDTANNISKGISPSWANAQLACVSVGKRLPLVEELKAVWNIYSSASAAGFDVHYYWSGTPSLAIPTSAYVVKFSSASGTVYRQGVSAGSYVRCVS